MIIRRIGDDPRETPSIGIGDLMKLSGDLTAQNPPPSFAYTEKELEVELERFAKQLERCSSALRKLGELG